MTSPQYEPAAKTDDGWLLNGRKAWITNAAISDIIICYAKTEPDGGRDDIVSFVVDGQRRGFKREAPYRLNGSHVIGTGGFELQDYTAGPEDILTNPGEGFASAMGGVNGARIYVAALCCSMVEAALAVAVSYGSERQAFGKSLLDHQGLAWSLASIANRLEAAKTLTAAAMDTLEAGNPKAVIIAAAHAKKFATEMAEPSLPNSYPLPNSG